MGCSMCSPNGDEKLKDIDNTKIKVRSLLDQKFIVKFLKDAPAPKPHKKSYFEFCVSKTQSPKSDGLGSIFETLCSTKEANVREFRSAFDRSPDRSDAKTLATEASQQVCDDYQSIQNKSTKIRRIGIYSSYYVTGIKIEFEASDLKTFSTFHCCPNFNFEKDSKVTYKEIELEDDEYIEHIFCVKSTQTNFIRNITLATNYERNICVEGEIEIYDIAKTSPKSYFESSQGNSRDIKNELMQSFSHLDEEVYPTDTQNFKRIGREFECKSIILEGEEDDFNIRKQSICEDFKKNQDCNLKHIQHRLIGLKTVFTNGYLEDIELYTAENDKQRLELIEYSHRRNNFVFI